VRGPGCRGDRRGRLRDDLAGAAGRLLPTRAARAGVRHLLRGDPDRLGPGVRGGRPRGSLFRLAARVLRRGPPRIRARRPRAAPARAAARRPGPRRRRSTCRVWVAPRRGGSVHVRRASPHPVYWTAIEAAWLLLFGSTGPVNSTIVNVVSPHVRATAVALSIFTIHILGDVPSPSLVGAISDARSLGEAMLIIPVAVLVG